MKLAVVCCFALAVLGSLVASGGAADSHSVSGTCSSIRGTVTYGAPVTNTPSDNTYDVSAIGVCSGSVDGQAITDARVAIHVTGPFTGACGDAHSTAPGPGTLTWNRGTPDPADDVSIAFTQEFTASGTELNLTYRGARTGSATGRATWVTSRTPPDIAVKCAGAGVTELPIDGSASTESPLVSGPLPVSPTLGAELAVPDQPIGDVLKHGLRATVRTRESAESSFSVVLTEGSAKRLRVRHRKLGSGSARVPAGGARSDLAVKLSRRARRALAGARGATVVLKGAVVGSTGVSALRERVRLHRAAP